MIKTVDNFDSSIKKPICEEKKSKLKKAEGDDYYCCIAEDSPLNKKNLSLDILLKDFKSKSKNNNFFSFFQDEDKNQDDLIISVQKDGENFTVKSGNYVGKLVWDGVEVEINSRFSDVFLRRMLNFANDVFLDDVAVDAKLSKQLDVSRFIIYYIFVQKLERAFLLGLPKSYKTINHHETKLKGKIDINRFIKHDIPFLGKISSTDREQSEIQEIIDMLHKAVNIVKKSGFSIQNIIHIKRHLKEQKSSKYITAQTIDKAMSSKALQNPIFYPYKQVLEYAKFIINADNLEENAKQSGQKTYGFLINVAELFEIYITKLLQRRFDGWSISSPKIEVYKGMFYSRKIIPDIVMEKEGQVVVFDTKYKRMYMNGRTDKSMGDVDRNDFFQINTYMAYYAADKDKKLIGGGLLYPVEKHESGKYFSDKWFEDSKTWFLVSGVDLSKSQSIDAIKTAEGEFLEFLSNKIYNRT
jgi:5-methylcytosine-specific restriction endonuclease McrBC regulatory subunit McrC